MTDSAVLKELERCIDESDLPSAESMAARLTDSLYLTRAYGLLASAYQRRGEVSKAEDCWARAFSGGAGVPLEKSAFLRLALAGDIKGLLNEADLIYRPAPLSETDFASLTASAMAAIFDSSPAETRRISRLVEKARLAMLAGDRDQAIQLMAFLSDRSIEKAKLFQSLATICAMQGLTNEAEQLITAAEMILGTSVEEPLHALCYRFIKDGNLDAALETLARIRRHDKYSYETRSNVAIALLEAGRYEALETVCNGFRPGQLADAAFLWLVKELESKGELRVAESICKGLTRVSARRQALRVIANGYKKFGLPLEAARVAAEIKRLC